MSEVIITRENLPSLLPKVFVAQVEVYRVKTSVVSGEVRLCTDREVDMDYLYQELVKVEATISSHIRHTVGIRWWEVKEADGFTFIGLGFSRIGKNAPNFEEQNIKARIQ